MIVLTYDEPEKALKFAKKQNFPAPILYDEASLIIRQFGILDEAYGPKHRFHGVPHPGIFVVDAEGLIQAKLAETDYRDRPAIEEILEAVKKLRDKAS